MRQSEAIGENIRRLRNARGMTQVDFANAIGRSQSMVAMYENGQRMPSMKIILKIAEVLGVLPGEIWTSGEEIEPKLENYDWYNEAFKPENDFQQYKFDETTSKKLQSLNEQLTRTKKSKEWRMLSEGFEKFEKKKHDEFQMVFKMLSSTYPEFFGEGDDDDDPES